MEALRQLPAEHNANITLQLVENRLSLFTECSSPQIKTDEARLLTAEGCFEQDLSFAFPKCKSM